MLVAITTTQVSWEKKWLWYVNLPDNKVNLSLKQNTLNRRKMAPKNSEKKPYVSQPEITRPTY